jgi:hypothetical protein
MKIVLCAMAVFLFCFCSTYTEAGVCQQKPQQIKTVVVFGNGIMNTKHDAEDSLERLRTLLHDTLTPEEFNNLEFNLAYNKTYGFLRDFYESLKQKAVSDNLPVAFWRWMSNREIVPDAVRDELKKMVEIFDFSDRFGGEDISSQLEMYRSNINKGRTTLVCAHSQGNEFVNAAYKVLQSENEELPNKLSVVAVATPASFVAGEGPHTTLVEDLVVQTIALATPPGVSPPMSSNITNIGDGVSSKDWKGHNFLDEYTIEGSNSEGKILGDMVAAINKLQESLVYTENNNVISIEVSWPNQPDMHMFVAETINEQQEQLYVVVDESNPTGVYGNFSTSFSDGVTTQKYSIPCGVLKEDSSFQIGVITNSGIPENVSVHVVAGFLVSDYEVKFVNGDIILYSLPLGYVAAHNIGGGEFEFIISDYNNTVGDGIPFWGF